EEALLEVIKAENYHLPDVELSRLKTKFRESRIAEETNRRNIYPVIFHVTILNGFSKLIKSISRIVEEDAGIYFFHFEEVPGGAEVNLYPIHASGHGEEYVVI